MIQLKSFRDATGSFGRAAAESGRQSTPPGTYTYFVDANVPLWVFSSFNICFLCYFAAEWWVLYGSESPNLRTIAVKVLSQTCSATGCERNWSTFSLIHTKRRNRLGAKRLEDLVYVHYNLRLKEEHIRLSREKDAKTPIELSEIFELEGEEVDPLNEWVTDRGEPQLDEAGGRPSRLIAGALEADVGEFMATEGRVHAQAARPFQTGDSETESDSPVSSGETQSPSATQGGTGDNDDDDDDGDDGGGDDRYAALRDEPDQYDQPQQPDPLPSPLRFTGETHYDHATQDTDHGTRPSGSTRGYTRGSRQRFMPQEEMDETDPMDISSMSDSMTGMHLGESSQTGGTGHWCAPDFMITRTSSPAIPEESGGESIGSTAHGGFGWSTAGASGVGGGGYGGYYSSYPSNQFRDDSASGVGSGNVGSSFVDSFFQYGPTPAFMPTPAPPTHTLDQPYPRQGYLYYVDDSIYSWAVRDYENNWSDTMSWDTYVLQSEERYRHHQWYVARGLNVPRSSTWN